MPPGTMPTSKIVTNGMAYTNGGIVWKASSTGLIAWPNRGRRPASRPTGTAMIIARTDGHAHHHERHQGGFPQADEPDGRDGQPAEQPQPPTADGVSSQRRADDEHRPGDGLLEPRRDAHVDIADEELVDPFRLLAPVVTYPRHRVVDPVGPRDAPIRGELRPPRLPADDNQRHAPRRRRRATVCVDGSPTPPPSAVR